MPPLGESWSARGQVLRISIDRDMSATTSTGQLKGDALCSAVTPCRRPVKLLRNRLQRDWSDSCLVNCCCCELDRH